jgi:predicted AlkP superfamily phosphohydrolase/phosphomutase
MPKQLQGVEHTLRTLCLEYFTQVDTFIGELVRMAGPDANVFIASDHGFGPSTQSFRINKWLEQRGYLRFPAPSAQSGRPTKNSHFVHLDWENTIVYAQSASTNGVFIRVQRQEGEPGIPAAEYHTFRARLIDELRAIRNPVTGARFLKDVLTREEAFSGAHQDKAPDLTLVPFDHGFVSVLDLEPIIAVRPVMGTHYPVGIFLGRGPSLARGRRISRQSIVDVAPTLLHSLGLPIPADYDGRVMEGVFNATDKVRQPVAVGPATLPPSGFEQSAVVVPGGSADDAIISRLRALGYIE